MATLAPTKVIAQRSGPSSRAITCSPSSLPKPGGGARCAGECAAEAAALQAIIWSCPRCTLDNDADASVCAACAAPRTSAGAAAGQQLAAAERPSTLRCGHTFHAGCAAQWISQTAGAARCPTCRQPVTLRRSLVEGALLVG